MGNSVTKLTYVKPSSDKPDLREEPQRLENFRYKVLKAATGKFHKKNLAGQGGCGDVYKGRLPYYGLPVAIKRIKKQGPHGLEEWMNELRILTSFHHPNVVKLLGYCNEGVHRMLVFEYIPMGSLEENLSRDCSRVVDWRKRMKIAKGIAMGLEYLHTMETPVIHRDVKSANILIDHEFTPRIADFGISRFGPQGDKTHISTRVLGTEGYFAPEYIGTGHLTLKTDVYSFGVVLLEILSGLRPVKRCPNGRLIQLSRWAIPYLSDRKQVLDCVIDKRIILNKQLDMEEAYEFAKIILQCLTQDPRKRPTVTQVLHSLQKIIINSASTSDC